MPGHEDGDHLVAYFLRRHAAAGLVVARGDQARQQVLRFGVGLPAALVQEPIHGFVELVEDAGGMHGRDEARQPARQIEQVDELRPHVHLILVDAALDDVDDLVGIRGEHRPRDDVQRRVHHRAGDVDLAPVGKRIPFLDELLRDLGHDRRIAGDAARIERRRHDAPMAAPGFAFGGEQAAAEPGLEQAARQLGLDVVGSVVEEHVPDGARLVDDDGAPPQQPAHQDVGVEILRRKRRKRVVAKHAQELTEAQAALRQPRRGKDGGFAAIDDAHGPCLTLKRRCREHRRYSLIHNICVGGAGGRYRRSLDGRGPTDAAHYRRSTRVHLI